MPPALRVLYVHGLGEHPAKAEYKRQWDDALTRHVYYDAIETDMVWWVDIRNGVGPDKLAQAVKDTAEELADAKAAASKFPQPVIRDTFFGHLQSDLMMLLDPLLRATVKELSDTIYLYFHGKYNAMRGEILHRMEEAIKSLDPHIIIAHSWGTVIALDYLMSFPHSFPTLITMGAPLGNEYIKNELHNVGGARPISYPMLVRRWVNVFDAIDPVTWPDRRLENDWCSPTGAHMVRDYPLPKIYDSSGKRYPHSWFGYLMSEPVQTEIFRMATSVRLGEQP